MNKVQLRATIESAVFKSLPEYVQRNPGPYPREIRFKDICLDCEQIMEIAEKAEKILHEESYLDGNVSIAPVLRGEIKKFRDLVRMIFYSFIERRITIKSNLPRCPKGFFAAVT